MIYSLMFIFNSLNFKTKSFIYTISPLKGCIIYKNGKYWKIKDKITLILLKTCQYRSFKYSSKIGGVT